MFVLKIKNCACFSPGNIIQALLCCLYSLAATSPIGYTSELWHLTIGQWIYSSMSVPMSDLWCSLGSDTVWRSVGWLSQLLMALAFQVDGFHGLVVLKGLVVFIFVYSLVCCAVVLARSRFLGVLIGLLSASSALEAVELQPELFGLACLAIYITLVYNLIDGLALEEKYLPLILVCALATNLHSSAALFLPLAFLLLCDLPLLSPSAEKAKPDKTKNSKVQALRVLLGLKVACASLVGLVLSPYWGRHLLGFSQWVISSVTLDVLARVHPANIFQYGFAICILLSALLGLVLASGKWRAGRGEIVLSLLCLACAASSSELSPWAGTILGMILARAIGEAGGIHVGRLDEALARLKRFVEAWPSFGTVWIILVISTILGNALVREPVSSAAWPERELDYLLSNDADLNPDCPLLLHSLAVSGYVAYRFSSEQGGPRSSAFISPDSKYYAPSAAIADGRLWRAFPGWDLIVSTGLASKGVVLGQNSCASPKFILVRLVDPLYQVLVRDPRWDVVLIQGDRDVSKRMQELSLVGPSGAGSLGWAILRKKG